MRSHKIDLSGCLEIRTKTETFIFPQLFHFNFFHVFILFSGNEGLIKKYIFFISVLNEHPK